LKDLDHHYTAGFYNRYLRKYDVKKTTGAPVDGDIRCFGQNKAFPHALANSRVTRARHNVTVGFTPATALTPTRRTPYPHYYTTQQKDAAGKYLPHATAGANDDSGHRAWW